MAPAAVNPPPMTALDEVVSKPPPGVVLPPKDIRAVAERTAGFVARNGAIFEDRVRSKENHNPKFSFLHANDAYHPFYQWRLSEIKEGRGTDVSAGPIGEAAKKPQEEPKGPEPPPEFEFSARMPIISAQDLEVVRLTALFVAKNGRSFMTALSQRETGNFQFDFLRPQHSLYQFFQRLVEQYKLLLEGNREQERLQQLRHNARDKFHLIDKAKTRAEWVKYQEAQKAQKEEADEAEKLAYAQIDWHDFVVVATIAFDENDEQAELPPPTSLNDLQSASLEQKAMMSLQPHNMRIEEAMPTAEDSYYPQPQHQPVQPPIQQLYPTPSSATPPVPGYGLPPPPIPPPFMAQDDEEELRIRERTEARERTQQAQAAARGQGIMNIKKDYVPRAQAKRQNQQMALCPNCKQQIPYDELEHHMRVELLDPRWKEQKQRADARFATTNLSTADVANNLKRLASQRSDVFDGVTGQPISDEEAARRKRAAMSYDGTMESKEAKHMQSLNIEEQIRLIHQRAGQSK